MRRYFRRPFAFAKPPFAEGWWTLAIRRTLSDASYGGSLPGTSEGAPLCAPGVEGSVLAELSSNGTAALPATGFDARPKARPRRIGRAWLVRRFLLAGDVVGLLTAFLLTELLVGNRSPAGAGAGLSAGFYLAAIPAWVIAAKLRGLYDHDDERAGHSTAAEFTSVFGLVTLGVWLVYVSSWVFGFTTPHPQALATFWLLAIGAITLSRAAARAVVRRQPAYLQNTIILGAGDVGQLIARKLLQHPEYGVNLLGLVDAEPKERREDLGDLQIIGTPDEVVEIVRREEVDRVIIAFSNESHSELLSVVHRLRKHNLQIDLVPRLFEAVNPTVGIHTVEGLPLLSLPPSRLRCSSAETQPDPSFSGKRGWGWICASSRSSSFGRCAKGLTPHRTANTFAGFSILALSRARTASTSSSDPTWLRRSGVGYGSRVSTSCPSS